MSTLPDQVDIHSRKGRLALTKMVIKLFSLWKITTADQAILLNRSLSTIRRYRNGGCFVNDSNMFDRVGYLLSIHKALRMLYPYDRDLVYRWVTAQNTAFGGQTALEVMKKEEDGIKKIDRYLGHQMYG
ncbi:MAG: DUF2384 domain-containing protein [Nostocales cyanobacterium W4_Combined_metabat2_030]|nr:DUF2384 domain-containing protein [Nostocales cyanobacterium W4_Combined_metabat2_030]